MQIELLHDFIVLSEELNFRSAAKALFTTPSTLSKHIATLENHYGVRLFNRDRTSVSLTNKGVVLLEGAQKVWDAYEQTLELVKHDQNASTLHISGTLDNPEDYPLVSRAITKFKVATGNIPHLLPSKSFSLKNKFPFWNQATPIALCSMWLKAFFARYMQMLRSNFTRWAGRVLMRWCLKAARLRTKRFWSFAISRGKISFSWLVPALRPRGCKSKISLMTPGFITPLRCFRLQHPMTILTLTPKGTCFCCLSFTMRQNATNRAAACAFPLMGKR